MPKNGVDITHWFRCPQCKGVGQMQGTVSIQCYCGFHGYAKDGELIELKAPL